MDKFVTKTVRQKEPKRKTNQKRIFKQATIESLKGVVVIEDVKRMKAKLLMEGTSCEEMIECLEELGQKIPPRHVMMETKIGKVVNNIRKTHADEKVKKAAKRVYIKWKKHFQDFLERPQIEVRCDNKTEAMRSSGRRLLSEGLQVEESNPLVEVIERETFNLFKKRISYDYRKHMRKLVFALKNNQTLRTKVLSKEISVLDFIQENFAR